jgi:hypothetical protein
MVFGTFSQAANCFVGQDGESGFFEDTATTTGEHSKFQQSLMMSVLLTDESSISDL